MTADRDKIIAAARLADSGFDGATEADGTMSDSIVGIESVTRFYAIAFAAGAASRDAEVVSLTNQRDYEYVRAENAEQERAQFEQESDQLREHVTMLRDALLTCTSIRRNTYAKIGGYTE